MTTPPSAAGAPHVAKSKGRIGAAVALPLALGLAANLAVAPTPPASPPTTGSVAVMTRHAILWSGPSFSASQVGTLEVGDIVHVMNHGHRAGYSRVMSGDEEVGWVSDRSVRAIDATEVHTPSPPPAPLTALTGENQVPGQPKVVSGAFDGCQDDGNPSPKGPKYQEILTLNQLKNRSSEPKDQDIDSTVTLERILASSTDDSGRWLTGKAAEIVGFVFNVKPGGATETTNCRKGDPVHRDAHIELVLGPSDTAETRRVIVEVTPRWRAAYKDIGVDWSTATLQNTIERRWVRVRGWLFFDSEHRTQAENTNAGGTTNWRATAWEIHPISRLAVIEHP